jgi:hypothetical protein
MSELNQLAENGSKGGDDVSCYTRHLGGLMEEIGLPDAPKNRTLMDRLLREILGYSAQDECSLVWTELKRWLADPNLKEELLRKIKPKLEEAHS